ncbi:hypothetical protein V6U80_12290 [Micromonospora sp. CPCC 205543]
MKVDDIRGQLQRRGVSGISALRKPELVKTLARTLRSESRPGAAARRSTGPAGRASATKAGGKKATGAEKGTRAKAAPAPARKATGARKAAPAKATTAKKTAAKKTAPAKTTPAKSTARAKAAPAKKTTRRAKAAPAKKTTPRAKAAPAKKTTAKTAPAGRSTTARKPTTRAEAGPAAGAPATGIRTGRSTSRSVRSSQLISSPADRPERPGRSLVTTNHEVIRHWAEARDAKPATIAGTERDDRPGVLTFDIPGYRESGRIRVISWEEWFRTFDSRGLNLIYQEQLRDGRPSNFFRTESPDREDA